MANPAGTTGTLLGRAATQAGKPGPGHLDVWKHSVEGAKNQMAGYDPDGPPPAVQSMEALGKGVAGDRHSSSPAAVGKGLSQQGSAIKKQLGQLFHTEGSKPPDGVLGHVGLAFGLLTSVEQLVSMLASVIPFPALPAVRILDMDIGLPHAHNHPPNLIPPAPPVPLPSTGPVIPIPFLSGAGTVLINGMPAARCGDMGLGIWCGGYFPMFEIFLGSSNVWVEGARAARLAVDITKHCTFTTPKPSDPPMGPMFGFTITASGDVAIGGVPMPSLSAMAMAAGFKALFKGLGKAFGKLRGKLGKGAKPNVHGPKVSNSPRAGAAAGGARLRGKASGKFFPCVTDRVDDLLGKLKGPGKVHKIPDGIYASELAALTRETGKEFGVAVRNGELILIEGTSDSVMWGAQDLAMVHTHPTPPGHAPTGTAGVDNISSADARVAKMQGIDDWPHPQAVIDDAGNVHHFGGDGVIDNPTMSPIAPDGKIDGLQRGPHGFVPRPTKYPGSM